jgi:glycosyltransferase involved in cell wall biosynthesis
MARICAQRGHEVVVFGNHGTALAARSTQHESVEYVFTPTLWDRLINRAGTLRSFGKSDRDLPDFYQSWHHRGYAEAAARAAKDRNCEVIHIMNYSQFVPVVRKIHPAAKTSLHMQCEWLTQLDASAVRARLLQTDLIVGCSEYIARKIADKFPEYAGRCVAVPNAADEAPSSKGVPAGSKVVLFVGRLSPEKGIHHLIRAFHTVLTRHPDATLHLVGGAGSAPLEFLVGLSDEPHVAALREFYPPTHNGDKDPYLVALEKEAGTELGGRIIFEGRVDHHQLERHYQGAAVLVNPSLSESFGISLVEAMMRKIPVIATRIGGMTYSVDNGENGFLVDPAAPQQLAEAICKVLDNPECARQMGEAGQRKAVDKFSWEKTADLLLTHLQSVVQK